MTFSAQSLLTDIYDAWRAHDLDLLASYLPDDFSHFINIPTEMHPLGEVRHGKAAVLERFALIFQQFDTKRLETGPIAPNSHGVAIEVQTRCRHRRSGAWLDTTKSNLWTLEDGWPVKLFEHYDLDQFRAFMKAAESGMAPGAG
jgi:ketosteroid isomerase-like protein